MAYTHVGLQNNGETDHYYFLYDTALPNGFALADGLQGTCEQDFAIMKDWFGGIDLIYDYPLSVLITTGTNGASWNSPSQSQMDWLGEFPVISLSALDPGGLGPFGQVMFLRYLLVSEVTEMFMNSKQNGWFESSSYFSGADEGSKGEGLSRFLGAQFLNAYNLGTVPPPSYAVSWRWINSARQDFVNNNPDDKSPDPTTGCATLFLWYLYDQLGYSVKEIIDAGADTLAVVYQKLTGRADAWGAFNQLLNSHFPPLPAPFAYNLKSDSVFPVPEIAQFFPPNQITAGYSDTSWIQLDRKPSASVVILLTCDDPSVVQVPSQVVIGPGSISTPVTFNTTALPIPFAPKIVAVHAAYGGTVRTINVELVPPRVVEVTLSPSSVMCGDNSTGTVTLDRPSLNGAVVVDLVNGAPGFATVPDKITIPQGVGAVNFTISTPNILIPFNPAHASILASYSNSFASAVLTVNPKVIAGILSSVTLFPNPVSAGIYSQGTVTLVAAVPTDTKVGLAATDFPALPGPPSGNSAIASVPSSITIPAGQTVGTFDISTKAGSVLLGSQRSVQILAAAVTTKYALLKVTA